MFVLPWEKPNVKRVVDAFDCVVADVVVMVAPGPEERLVVWRDDTDDGKIISERITEKDFRKLSNDLECMDVGQIISSGWWEGGE